MTRGDILAIGKESWCGHPLYTTETKSAWIAPRKDGTGFYAAVFNLSDRRQTITLGAEELEAASFTGTELWSGRNLRRAKQLKAALAPHDAAVWFIRY